MFLRRLFCFWYFDCLLIVMGSISWESNIWMWIFGLVCFCVVIVKVSLSFHASTDFGFRHVSEFDFWVFLIFVLFKIGHIVILGVLSVIKFAKNIQLVDGRRSVIGYIVGTRIDSPNLRGLDALRTSSGWFYLFFFTDLILMFTLGWSGTFQ